MASTLSLLVFPVDMDAAKHFISVSQSLGVNIIGASSVASPNITVDLDHFTHMPYITDPAFTAALKAAVEDYSVTHIYTPHPGVWAHLKYLQTQQPDHYSFKLCHPSPVQTIWDDTVSSYEWAENMALDVFLNMLESYPGSTLKPRLTRGRYISLHKQFFRIPGESDINKLTALAHISRTLPQGDLIEIGSFCGRSAFAIAWLAKQYEIGNLISIDPWSSQKIEQQGQQAEILNRRIGVIDFDKIFLVYISNMLLLDNVGYIREISSKAINQYKQTAQQGILNSSELSPISVSGAISLLHIDGNHHYTHVCQDIDAWAPYVMPGGWILLDDYVWAFGDGPKRAGDELLASRNFDLAFSMGDTLYLRKMTASDNL
ncbi:MAG: class I SAM-dependent methyltransferase [Candidatus Thiodiazotropha sp. (ex Lucinoma annulata)]|nr:class I SAM-dependent methyltransferase [Candidatus Thiodiazotropha sp. (ex Lucinoma annulata)]